MLYSALRGKYYVGSTSDIEERIKKHDTNHAGFTGNAGDWVIKWKKVFAIKEEAGKRKRQIKG